MRRLICTIAIGDKSWGAKSLNLALSIKANSEDIETGLIYSESAIEGIEELIEQHFDFKFNGAEYPLTKQPIRQIAFFFKIMLFKIIDGYDEIIFLDADEIIMPGKNISSWFDELKDNDVAFYTNDILDYTTGQRRRKDTDHTFWCDTDEARGYFELDKPVCGGLPFIPQVDACFFYFNRSYKAKFFFEIAQDVYNSSFETTLYKGVKLAEPCFNIACAKMGIRPTPKDQSTYRPVYLEAFDKPQSTEFIQHQYNAFGFAGMNEPSKELSEYYNKLSNYYREYHGIQVPFKLMERKKVKGVRHIYGFWHIYMANHYLGVAKEQLEELVESGLYDGSKKIVVGAVGKNVSKLKSLFKGYPKIEVVHHSGNAFEFDTLKILQDKVNKSEPIWTFYIHAKSVTLPKSWVTQQPTNKEQGDYFRWFLNHYTIAKWVDNISLLKEGYDTSGAGWIMEGMFKGHYRGNFWWADSEYIRQLPKIDSLDKNNRFNAEFWIGMANANAGILSKTIVTYEDAKQKYLMEVKKK